MENKQADECPHCAEVELLAREIAAVLDQKEISLGIEALARIVTHVITSCAPTLNDAVLMQRQFDARVVKAIFHVSQTVGIPVASLALDSARLN